MPPGLPAVCSPGPVRRRDHPLPSHTGCTQAISVKSSVVEPDFSAGAGENEPAAAPGCCCVTYGF